MLHELVIYQKIYDLMLYAFPIINRFPKSQRFVLGQQIQNTMQSWLGHSSHANTYNLRKHIFGECILQRTPALLELATEE